jgi:DUF4097 and DUF4098 domain-containing protein YvlB
MSRLPLVKPIAVLMCLSGAALAFAGSDRPEGTERFVLPAGDAAIYDLAGSVKLQPGGNAMTVEVSRAGRDAAELKVATGPIGGAQTLRVLFPGDRIVHTGIRINSRTEVNVRDDGTFSDDSHRAAPSIGRKVVLATSGEGTEAHADLVVSVPENARVSLYLGLGVVDVTNVNGALRIDTSSGPVTSHGTHGLLDIDTGAGVVSVRDAEGDLKVDTGSGEVTVQNVRGGDLKVDTGSGTVRVAGARADLIRVDTGSGGVELADIHSPDVGVDTGSGGVTVDLAEDISNLDVDTGSGGVDVWVPKSLGAEFALETGNGSIHVDVPYQSFHVERDDVRGRFGDGKGRIRIETGSGGVQIRPRGNASHGGSVGGLLGRAID